MSTASSRHHHKPPWRRRQSVKLPRILSDSSFTSSPPPNHNFSYNSTFSSTHSHTSSMWNWENFYPPPSPPDSKYFDKLNRNQLHTNDDDSDNSSSNDDEEGSPTRSDSEIK
ncbi:hypothetical protein C2S52_015983 [Perilla frutescens var. hirtella]|nr:hypothetical protein C2S52_015983 [Perilla frutescens var. hirtella]